MKELLRALIEDRNEDTQESEVSLDWSRAAQNGADVRKHVLTCQQEPRSAAVIEVHPKARANFDAKAETLLTRLIRAPAEVPDQANADTISTSEQIATPIPAHAVRAPVEVFRDAEGIIVARCFVYAGEIVGLQSEGYRALRELADAMQRLPGLRLLVGNDTVEQLIFLWVRARVLGTTTQPMVEHVLDELGDRVRDFEVVVPLFRVELPEPVQIGRVTLRTITSTDFAHWEDRAQSSGNAAKVREIFDQPRKMMQGFTSATISLRGEQNHVLEVARHESAEAASILRLFAPAILSPTARSFCALWGRHNLENTLFILNEEGSGVTLGRQVDTSHEYVWRITPERLRLMRREAMDALIAELFSGKEGGFRGEVSASLLLYSDSAMRRTPAEKLLAILIPLESLMLGSQTEPIVDTIAVRVAFAIGASLDERKRIVEVIRAAYALRSGYVHHRREITALDDLDTLREFMLYAWRMLMTFGTTVVRDYSDRKAYLKSLDDRKLA